jgi:hypothetical protein
VRRPVDASRLREFIRALGHAAKQPVRVYFTGGATAVLVEWRRSTIDVDLKLEPEDEGIFSAIPALKESLEINVELASPGDFIPELPGWRQRSPFIAQEGQASFHHYDFYAQALAKIERGHALDLVDVKEMKSRGLVEPLRLLELFEKIEGELGRYPAIDPATFRRAVEDAARRTA